MNAPVKGSETVVRRETMSLESRLAHFVNHDAKLATFVKIVFLQQVTKILRNIEIELATQNQILLTFRR